MISYADTIEILQNDLEQTLPGVFVTEDTAKVKPSNSRLTIWIQPPQINWEGYLPEYSFTLYLVAGTPEKKFEAVHTIIDALETLTDNHFPIQYAVPSGFELADTGTELAAYEVHINPIDHR